MAKLKEEAMAYEPSNTKNIADLDEVSVELDLLDGSGTDKDGKDFKYKYIVVKEENYRVPGIVLSQLKGILEENPNLTHFKVKRNGSGLATQYQVIAKVSAQKV